MAVSSANVCEANNARDHHLETPTTVVFKRLIPNMYTVIDSTSFHPVFLKGLLVLGLVISYVEADACMHYVACLLH